MKIIKTAIILLAVALCGEASAQRALYVLSQGTGIGRQSIIPFEYGSQFEPDLLRATWDNDEHIIAAGFTYHGLQLATARHPSWGNQTYNISQSYPADFISEMGRKGYTITELSSDGLNWLVIATEVTPRAPQLCFSFDDPAGEEERAKLDKMIASLAADKYFITDIACSGNVWAIVTTYNPDITDQIYDFPTAAQDISDYFMRNQTLGYRISAADYGPGHYFCVMTRSKGTPKAQAVLPGVENPNEVMDRYWGMKFSITHIAH